MRRRNHGTTHDALHMMRSRMRSFETLGVGLGVFAVACAVSLVVIGTEVIWQSVNRGKSFEEVVQEMQEKPNKKYASRKIRREASAPPEGA